MQKYTGINIVRRRRSDGTFATYRYHRATGRRLPGEPGSVEFDRAYIAAEIAARAPQHEEPSGIETLCHDYHISPEWKTLAASTRALREPLLEDAKRFFATFTLRDWNDRRMRTEIFKWRDSFSDTPAKADNALRALSAMLTWAYDRAILDVNHARRVPYLAPKRPRAKKIWSVEQERIFIEAASPAVRRLFCFALWTAMRRDDMASLRWEQYDGRWLVYTPKKTERKTGVEVHLPVYELPPLRALLDEMPRTHEFVLTSTRGRPFTHCNIGRQFWVRKGKAFAIDIDRTLHDLRGTAAQRLLEAGCTEAEVCAITGHAIGGEDCALPSYVDRSRKLAINAYRKWWRAMQMPQEDADVIPFKARE